MALSGLRVIRCGESVFGEQDGGEFHAGTVSASDILSHAVLPKNMIFIAWDSGTIANYCRDSLPFDLRVFDNAQAGKTQVGFRAVLHS
jgi:hypothetical protein